MKVLVTGGSGNVGMAVIEHLRDHGLEVFNLDIKRPEKWVCPYRTGSVAEMGEVYDALAVIRPDAVCHIAADPRPWGGPRHQTFGTNVQGTFNVLQVCGDLGINRVAWASSEQALGYSGTGKVPNRIPLMEEDSIPAVTAYALSKQVGEKVAESMAQTYPDLAIASLRLNYVSRPEEAEHWRQREAGRPPSGHYNFWGYVDMTDTAEAFRLAITQPLAGHHVLNIVADDTMLSTPTLEALQNIAGRDIEAPEDFPEFGSAMSNQRAREVLGWVPQFQWRD